MNVILKESLVKLMQKKGHTDILVSSKHYNT